MILKNHTWLLPRQGVVMAYRELGVIEVREVLRRFCLGEGLRAIARGTGSDRKTIAKYVAAALAQPVRLPIVRRLPTLEPDLASVGETGAGDGGRAVTRAGTANGLSPADGGGEAVRVAAG